MEKKICPKSTGRNIVKNGFRDNSQRYLNKPFQDEYRYKACKSNTNEMVNGITIGEGIGPKISELFRENGIATWKSLAEATIPRLQEILNSKGQRYKVHNPKSWPMQSQMAYEGKWAELKKWQDEHDYGKA